MSVREKSSLKTTAQFALLSRLVRCLDKTPRSRSGDFPLTSTSRLPWKSSGLSSTSTVAGRLSAYGGRRKNKRRDSRKRQRGTRYLGCFSSTSRMSTSYFCTFMSSSNILFSLGRSELAQCSFSTTTRSYRCLSCRAAKYTFTTHEETR